MNELLVTSSNAAWILGVHESTVKRWCNDGEVDVEQTAGGHRRIRLHDVVALGRKRKLESPLLACRPYEAEVFGALEAIRTDDSWGPTIQLFTSWIQAGKSQLPTQLILLLTEMEIRLGRTFDRLIAAVLKRMGEAWQDGKLDTAQEHHLTQTLLDVLHRLRLRHELWASASAERDVLALIACVPGSNHELGAMMVRVALEYAGFKTYYLGSDALTEDVAAYQQRVEARLVCLSVVPPQGVPDLRRAVQTLDRLYNESHPYVLVFGGAGVTHAETEDLDARFDDIHVFGAIEPFIDKMSALLPGDD